MKSFLQYISESFVSPNNGAKYGQVIFLVGGAASGKSTAIRKFIDSSSYKTINPDGVKDLMRQASEKGITGFEDLARVDPNTPISVSDEDLYMIVNERVITIKKSGKRVDRSGDVAKKVVRTLGIL